MKKIALLLIFLAIPSFAIYVDAGLGIGASSTEVDDQSVDKMICKDCDELAMTFGVRVGGQVSERFWIARNINKRAIFFILSPVLIKALNHFKAVRAQM